MAEYWRGTNANRGGVFTTSRQSDALLDRARAIAAAFLNAEAPEEVIFGPNMTTLTFAFSRALARDLHPGDEIVLSRLEHDANVAPGWRWRSRACGFAWPMSAPPSALSTWRI